MEEYVHIDISKLLHCGVYALLKKGVVVYVGKSKQPMVRLSTHFRNRGKELARTWNPDAGPAVNGRGIGFDGAWFVPCMLGQLDIIEGYLIRKYLPKYNIKGKPAMPIPDDIKALLKQMVYITDMPPQQDPVSRSYMVRRL